MNIGIIQRNMILLMKKEYSKEKKIWKFLKSFFSINKSFSKGLDSDELF